MGEPEAAVRAGDPDLAVLERDRQTGGAGDALPLLVLVLRDEERERRHRERAIAAWLRSLNR